VNPFHFEKKYFKNADWLLNLSIFIFLIASSLMIFSTSRNIVENQPYYYVIRHLIAMGLGMGLFLVSSYLDYHFWQNLQIPIYLVMILMLIAVLFIGMEGDYGGQSWIPMGPISLQPVELAKIILILNLAGFYPNEKRCNSVLCLFWLLLLWGFR
jgi:cell division protein FtsW (lipid II flippase)